MGVIDEKTYFIWLFSKMTAHANENGSSYFNVWFHLSLHLLL